MTDRPNPDNPMRLTHEQRQRAMRSAAATRRAHRPEPFPIADAADRWKLMLEAADRKERRERYKRRRNP